MASHGTRQGKPCHHTGAPRASGRPRSILCGVLLSLLIPGATAAEAIPSAEYKVKAAFLYNFTQFVTWPPKALPEGGPLVIAVLGEDPFGSFLDELVRGQKVLGHPLVVERFDTLDGFGRCHLLFVGSDEAGQLPEVFSRARQDSILTVGDREDFVREGGMIRFIKDARTGKVRFEVNLDAVSEAKLAISSKLLRAAQIAPRDKK